jgi:hypothetical protein
MPLFLALIRNDFITISVWSFIYKEMSYVVYFSGNLQIRFVKSYKISFKISKDGEVLLITY